MTLQALMQMADGSGGGDSAPSGQKDFRTIVANVGRIMKDVKTGVGKKLGSAGINFGLAALLKQSQLFTGFVGSLFQIVGGFIDVILAPFMPYAFKVLGFIAKIIPLAQEKLAAFSEWIGGIWEASNGIGDFLGNLAAESFALLANTLSDLWSKIRNYDWGVLVTRIYQEFENYTSNLIDGIGNAFPFLKPELDDLKESTSVLKENFVQFTKDTEDDRKVIGSALGTLAGSFKDSVTEDLKAAGQALSWIVKIGSSAVFQFLTDVIGMTADIIKWTGEFWKGLNHLGRIFETSWNWLKSFFTGDLFQVSVVTAVKNGIGAVGSLISNIWDWLGGVVSAIKTAAMNVLNAVLDPIKALIRNISGIVETIANPGKAISGLFSRAKEGLGGMVGGGGGGSLDITINGSSISPQEMAEGRASIRGNISGQSEFSANQLMFDGG